MSFEVKHFICNTRGLRQAVLSRHISDIEEKHIAYSQMNNSNVQMYALKPLFGVTMKPILLSCHRRYIQNVQTISQSYFSNLFHSVIYIMVNYLGIVYTGKTSNWLDENDVYFL